MNIGPFFSVLLGLGLKLGLILILRLRLGLKYSLHWDQDWDWDWYSSYIQSMCVLGLGLGLRPHWCWDWTETDTIPIYMRLGSSMVLWQKIKLSVSLDCDSQTPNPVRRMILISQRLILNLSRTRLNPAAQTRTLLMEASYFLSWAEQLSDLKLGWGKWKLQNMFVWSYWSFMNYDEDPKHQ